MPPASNFKQLNSSRNITQLNSQEHPPLYTTLHTLALYYFDLSQNPTENLNCPKEFVHLALCCLNAAFQFTDLPITLAIENRLQICRIYLSLEQDTNYYILLQENISKALLLCQKLSVGHDLYFELRVLQLRALYKYQKKSQAQVVLLQTLEEAQKLGLYAWSLALLTYVDQWETPPVLTLCQKYWEQDPTPILVLTFLQLRHSFLNNNESRYMEFRRYFSKLSSLPHQLPESLQWHVLFWDLLAEFHFKSNVPSSLLDSLDVNVMPSALETTKVNVLIHNRCPSTSLVTRQNVQVDLRCSVQEVFLFCQFLKAMVLKRESAANKAEKLLKLTYQNINGLGFHSNASGLKPFILHQLFECSMARSQFTLASQLLELFCLSPCPPTSISTASSLLSTSIAYFLQALGHPSTALSVFQTHPQDPMSILAFLQLHLGHSNIEFPSLPNSINSLLKITEALFRSAWETEVNARKKTLLEVLRSTKGIPQLQCLAFALGGCLHSFSDLEKSQKFFEFSIQLAKQHHLKSMAEACVLAHECTPFTSTLELSKDFVSDSNKALEGLVGIFDRIY